MSLHSLIANGGKVVVVGGTMNDAWAKFKTFPQLDFWCGDRSEIERHMKNGDNLPHNVKAVIISRFISHQNSTKVMEEARRKRALIIGTLNDGEITKKLQEIFTPDPPPKELPPMSKPAPVTTPVKPTKGRLTEFIAKNHRAEGLLASEGKRLYTEALKVGIATTESSCIQAAGLLRKKLGIAVGPRAKKFAAQRAAFARSPESVAPVPLKLTPTTPTPAPMPQIKVVNGTTEDDLIKVLDDAMLSLQLVKEEVLKFKSNRDDYVQLKAKLAELIR